MSSHSLETDLVCRLLLGIIKSQKGAVSPEVARYLLSIEFGAADRKRMMELADQSEEGELTEEERAEFDSYLHIGNLLGMMQAKARVVLGSKPPSAQHS